MPPSNVKVLLNWTEDLQQGLEEISRYGSYYPKDLLLEDLLRSATQLLATTWLELDGPLCRRASELKSIAEIKSITDITNLCAQVRQALDREAMREFS